MVHLTEERRGEARRGGEGGGGQGESGHVREECDRAEVGSNWW